MNALLTIKETDEILTAAYAYVSGLLVNADVTIDRQRHTVRFVGDVPAANVPAFRRMLDANGLDANQYLKANGYDLDDNVISYFCYVVIEL